MIYDNKTYSERALNDLEPAIQYWCSRFFIKGYDKEDLEQEVRLRLWTKFDKFNPNKKVLVYTWGNQVVQNCLNNLLRDSLRQKRDNGMETAELDEKCLNLNPECIDLDALIDEADEKGIDLCEFL